MCLTEDAFLEASSSFDDDDEPVTSEEGGEGGAVMVTERVSWLTRKLAGQARLATVSGWM